MVTPASLTEIVEIRSIPASQGAVGAQDFLLLLPVRSISRLFHHASLPLTQSATDALNQPIPSEGKYSRIHQNRLWRSPTFFGDRRSRDKGQEGIGKMNMRKGERWICSNPTCRCEIVVTAASAPEEGVNPRCCCGSKMKKVYAAPTLWTRQDFEDSRSPEKKVLSKVR